MARGQEVSGNSRFWSIELFIEGQTFCCGKLCFDKIKEYFSILFCLVIYSMAGGLINIFCGRCGYHL
jgi:hypothetical protein